MQDVRHDSIFNDVGSNIYSIFNEVERGEKMEENNNPNGISWFALGFSIASLIAVLLK